MDGIGQLILKTITELFGNNYIYFLIYVSLLFVTIWLFREFKNKVDNEEKNKKEKIETILTILIDLKFEVKDFYQNKDNLKIVKEKLVKASPYLSYELCQDIYKFSEQINENEITEFISKLSVEIDTYKSEQNNEILQLNKITIGGIIGYYYKTMFKPVVLPILLTLLAIIIGLLLLYIFLGLFQSNSIADKYYLLQQTVNIIIFVSLIIFIIDSLIMGKLNWGKREWISIIILLIASLICLGLFSEYNFLAIINCILYILFPKTIKLFKRIKYLTIKNGKI